MAHWLIKAAVHRAISALPNRQAWNGLLQKWITRSTQLTPQAFEDKTRECCRHLTALRAVYPKQDFTVLEVGTGWLPIIPVGLWLCGARELWTFDIDPLVKTERLLGILRYYSDVAKAGTLSTLLPEVRQDRIQKLNAVLSSARAEQAPATVLEQLNIHYLVQGAQQTSLADGTIDYFVSSGVLEYVPRVFLPQVLREFYRVGVSGAAMSHRLNLVDQYSYFDSNITAFNFLKFTEQKWAWLDSPLMSQNRLRMDAYRTLLRDTGFELLKEENVSGTEEDLAKVELAPEFRQISRADLLVIHSFITARRSDARPAKP